MSSVNSHNWCSEPVAKRFGVIAAPATGRTPSRGRLRIPPPWSAALAVTLRSACVEHRDSIRAQVEPGSNAQSSNQDPGGGWGSREPERFDVFEIPARCGSSNGFESKRADAISARKIDAAVGVLHDAEVDQEIWECLHEEAFRTLADLMCYVVVSDNISLLNATSADSGLFMRQQQQTAA